MNRVPVHAGLAPDPLVYADAGDPRALALAAACGAVRVEAAQGPGHDAGCYRLTAPSGVRWFARLVPQALAAGATQAAALAARLSEHCPEVPAPRGDPLRLATGHAAIVWPWLDGRFAQGHPPEAAALGATVARLHAGLRELDARSRWLDADAAWAAAWDRLVPWVAGGGPGGAAGEAVDRLLRDRSATEARLRSDQQPLHNDLHPGNVFFDAAGGVQAVFDWEEALHSAGSPWIDLAWVVERFCATPGGDLDLDRSAAFLAAWRSQAGPFARPRPGVLHDAMAWRSVQALALLAGMPGGDPAIGQERRKFTGLLERLAAWRPLLAQLEAPLR